MFKKIFSYFKKNNPESAKPTVGKEQIRAENRLKESLRKTRNNQFKNNLGEVFKKRYLIPIDELNHDFPGWKNYGFKYVQQGEYIRLPLSEYFIDEWDNLYNITSGISSDKIQLSLKERQLSLWDRYPIDEIVVDPENNNILQLTLKISDGGVSFNVPSSLKSLSVRNGSLEVIYQSVVSNNKLKYIDLRDNNIKILEEISKTYTNKNYRDTITQLSLAENNLESLKGLENYISLQELNLSENHIQDKELVHLNSLYQLKKLDLSYNPIQDITPILELFNHNLKSLYVHEDVSIPSKSDYRFSERIITLANLKIKEIYPRGLTQEELKYMAQSSPSVIDKGGLTENLIPDTKKWEGKPNIRREQLIVQQSNNKNTL